MKFKNLLTRALILLAAAFALAAFAADGSAARAAQDDKDKQNQPKASKGEAELGEKINKAPDAATKLQLAEEFVKKYPKSAYRQPLADYVSAEVGAVADGAQRITLTEKYIAVFTGPGEGERLTPVLFDLYINANRLDDAYRVGGAWLAKDPNEVGARARLALLGVNEAQKQNPKFMTQSVEYAKQAIALLEADKKPATLDDAQWQQAKVHWLPLLHQTLGIVAYSGNNMAEARAHLDKAVALKTTDPTTYYVIAEMADREYADMATKYKAMSPGAEQDAQLKKALEKLDQAIELYAQAVALTEGRPEHKALREHIMQPLTDYFKYRHNGSTDGLQQLIDKHKTAAKP